MPRKDPEKRRKYQREYMREWYQKNKAKHLSYVRNGQEKIKAWLAEYKKSINCEICGECSSKIRFQHKNPQSKRFFIGNIRNCPSIKALQEEIAKCRALCPACFYHLNFPDMQPSANGTQLKKEEMPDQPRKESQQLGMSYGKAQHRLRKLILLELLKRYGENVCFRCGLVIETAADLSVEHKQPWLDVSPDLFWDLSNIAFSHLRCNRPNRPVSEKWKKVGPEGTAWCTRCKQFLSVERFKVDKKRWNNLSDYCTPCHTNRQREWQHRKALKKQLKGPCD